MNVVYIKTPIWVEISRLCYLHRKMEGKLIQNHPTAIAGSIWITPDYKFVHYIDEENNERELDIQDLVNGGVLYIDSESALARG